MTCFLSGCVNKSKKSPVDVSADAFSGTLDDIPINTEAIAATVAEEIIDEITNPEKKMFSNNWEDYKGDLETFVYGLIINQLQYKYDVFPAYTDLQNGESVFGLAYTDYSECYASEDQSTYAFAAGFIPYKGEPDIPGEDFDAGLQIYNQDYSDSKASFFMAYGSNAFREHCIVYDQYVQYGVDESGKIFYDAKKYEQGECDESLGSLYSYDETKYVYDVDVGEYIGVTGTSLYGQIDYDELEAEINRILKTQDINFASIDIETNAYAAQEAVTSYLLSLQEETFLGYNVSDLVKAASELDPLECYRFTTDGLEIVPLDYDGGATAVTKWLVGTNCAIITAVAMVGAMVFIECPPLSAMSGAMAGTAIDILMQVVIAGETLDNINWNKVALAAATGAVSGFLGPYVYATTEGPTYFALDSALDGLIGGIEYAANSWMEGKEGIEIIKSFGFGVALGCALSAGFKAAGTVVSKVTNKVMPGIQKMAEEVFPKLTEKASKFTAGFGKKIYELKKVADSSLFHSAYISRRVAERQAQKLIQYNSDELIKKAFDNLGVESIVDKDGNTLSKEAVKKLFEEADDGAILAYFKNGTEFVQIVKKNGMVGIVFDPSKYQTITIPGGLTADRSLNFEEAAKILKKQWLDDSSLIPESLAAAIKNSSVDLEDMMPEDLVSIIQKSDWVIHENIDLMTITLVPRAAHEGLSHMGGVGLAKYLKGHMGKEFFDRLLSAAATGVVQAAF